MAAHTSLPTALDESSATSQQEGLCNICASTNIGVLCSDPLSYNEPLELSYGSVAEVASRTSCPFCRLITRLIPFEQPPEAKISVSAHLGVFNVFQDRRWRGHIYAPMPAPGAISSTSIMINAESVRGWIEDCETKHAEVDKWTTDRYKQTIDIILIDVLENKLVRKTSGTRYITLSYVWGGKALHHLTPLGWPQLQETDSIKNKSASIPRLFHDMMELTRMLSERYCWIDALCIPQDNQKQKKHQISQMDIIYRQALVTVIVLSADNSQACIPGVRPGTRLPVDAVETINDIQLLARRPSMMHTMSNSAHWTRGWTYQEQLLSKRCLYLSNHEAMFYCHGTVLGDAPGAANSLDLQRHVKSLNKLSPLFDEDITQQDLRPESWFKALPLYAELTSEFSSRRLSDLADALDAFSGILSVMKYRLGGHIVSGLPINAINETLLWVPANDSLLQRNLRFPSWSWAGWTGTISYTQGPVFPTPLNMSIAVAVKSEIYLVDRIKESRSFPVIAEDASPHLDPTSPYRFGEQYQDIRKFPINGASISVWAFAADVRHFPPEKFSFFGNSREGANAGYKSMSLLDGDGHHCGIVFTSSLPQDLTASSAENKDCRREYILLSRSEYPDFIPEFRNRRVRRNILREPLLSHYRSSLFNHEVYSPRPWCLMNVMLVEWKGVYAERLAICQIHEDAWQKTQPEWKHFILG